FSQGTNGFVRLSNNTSESGKLVMADATLFVFSGPPTLLSQPQDQTVFEGNTAGFNVIANSATPLSYQWQFNSVDIFGATSSSLVLSNAQFSQAGNYSVLVGNSAGTVTSAPAMLTVLPVVPPQFDAITLLPDQTVRLTLSGATGAIYAIEFSTNFSSWLPIANVTNQSGTVEFIDSETLSTQQMRYYRARVEP
ncbi:MAG: immunoglobulin domain-containing protein, partial [Verrucomicrobiota bacterium]